MTITRFRSFVETSTFVFDQGPGLYFLKGENRTDGSLGSNDSGKSTTLDAFMWCLSGETVQGLKNPDVIPWTGKGTTEVTVHLAVDDVDHTVKRTIGPNLLTIDDKEAGQAYVDRLLGIPFKIFPYTVIIGQRQDLFFDLTAAEKLRVFSECLDLERWEKLSKKAADLGSLLDNDLVEAERRLAECRNKADHVASTLKVWKDKSKEWEQERADALKHQDHDKANIEALLASTISIRDKADLDLDRAETEVRGSSLDKLRLSYSGIQMDTAKIELAMKNDIRLLAKAEATLDSLSNTACPTCGQPLTTSGHKELSKQTKLEIKALKDQIQKARKTISDNKTFQDDLDDRIKLEKTAYDQFKRDAADARDRLLRASREVSEFEAQLRSLNQRIEDYENKDNPFSEEIKKLRGQLNDINNDFQATEDIINEKTAQLDRVSYWVKGFNEIKLYTLVEILQEYEMVTNAMLEEFGLSGWSVRFDVEKENKSGTVARKLNTDIYSPRNKDPVKWGVWGGGVSQRLRIAGTVALAAVLLNHIGISTNLMVFDEPTTSLSAEGAKYLIDLLAQRAKDTNQAVWLIDHLAQENDQFRSVVTVVKDERGSHINRG